MKKTTKRETVLRLLNKHPEYTNARIATMAECSYDYVWKIRRERDAPLELKETDIVSEEAQLDLPLSGVDAVLDERHTSYGTFADMAGVAQDLKGLFADAFYRRDTALVDYQQEALDMICTKLARIVNGDPNHVDSWRDIAGYATLVVDQLEGKPR